MAYSTQATIEAAIGVADLAQLADGGTGTTIPGLVTEAVIEADRLIDSYGRKRFTAARLAASQVIARLSARMAVRILRRNRRMVLASDVENEKTDQKWLEDLAKGMVVLETDDDGTATPLLVDKAGERPTTKNVSRNRLKGFW